jgi:hypothetical protein
VKALSASSKHNEMDGDDVIDAEAVEIKQNRR